MSALQGLSELDTLNLADVSSRDKVWDNHRANSDIIAGYFRQEQEFVRYSQRIDECSKLLDFRLIPDKDIGALVLKLSSAKFCRVRYCPVCQWRRSLMWKAKTHQILPLVAESFPKHRWLFLTLTVKNCPIEDLRHTIGLMHKAWTRLSQLKKFPAVGWIRSLEVTRSADGSAHPHFHCLLMVPPSYFGKGYLKQSEWVRLWQKSLRIDYAPVVDVRALKKESLPSEIIPELIKYSVKESDLIDDRDWFLELASQMHRVRCVAVGGVLREYLQFLESYLEESDEDLIGNESDGDIDEGHLYFGWRQRQKQYQLIS